MIKPKKRIEFRFCKGCNLLFPPQNNAQKFHSKECRYKYYYEKNKERIKENTYNWRKDNPDKYKKLQREYYEKRKKLNK